MLASYTEFATVASAEAGLTPEQFHEALAATLRPDPATPTPAARCERVWSECPASLTVRAAQIVGRARVVA